MTRAGRRLGAAVVGLCVLLGAGSVPSVVATAAPPASPRASTEPSSWPTPSTSTSYLPRRTAFSLTLSPARLAIGPDGLDQTQRMTLVNRGEQPVSVTVEKRNFVAEPDGGLNYQVDAPYGAADWVRVSPDRLTLQPGGSEQVAVTFDVPAAPEPGDHQVALVFLTPSTTRSGSGNIRVNRGIGAPIYLTVPGPVDDSVRLESLTGPRWSWRGSPTLTLALRSTGTVHRDFRGDGALSVGTSGHPTRFGDFTVARGSQRVVSTAWKPPLVCICRPAVSFSNPGAAPQSVSTTVVVAPWWLLAGVALVLVVGALVWLRARRRLRRTGDIPTTTAASTESG